MRTEKTKQYKIELAPTLGSGHYYNVEINGRHIGLLPSSTTILSVYPKSQQLIQWIASHGMEESYEIRNEAGKRGTQVHNAIQNLLAGGNAIREQFELEEWWKLNTFKAWYDEYKPEILATEKTLYSKKYRYAGTVDCIIRLGGKICIVDWKTAKTVHPEYSLQVAAYAYAAREMGIVQSVEGTAVLLLGARNKNGFRFIEYEDWEDDFKDFLAVKKIFDREQPEPPQVLNLPESLKL